MSAVTTIIKPQQGPQEQFLSTEADIAVYGGAAGAGKSFALLMEPLRHVENPDFGAVVFRRESPQITAEGGLWDTSFGLYASYGATPVQSPKLHWRFPSGSKVSFSHLQHEKNIYDWQGSQIPLLGFDELTHFTEKQFFYLLSRNRTTCGVKPYVRATTNPDPDSWLCKFLIDGGYVSGETGYPIYEMSGVVRYFIRKKGIVYWFDSEEEAKEEFNELGDIPKSFTFIPATIQDNQILLEINPEYLGNLNALLDYEQEQLIKGNWLARPNAGELFKRSYFKVAEYEDFIKMEQLGSIRYWDRAATLPNDNNPDPDFTVGGLMVKCEDENFYIVDIVRDRLEPGDVENLLLSVTEQDDYDTIVGLEQEPGASGKAEVWSYKNKIKNRDVIEFPKTKNKLTCWKPLARAAKNGKIYIVRGPWNKAFLAEAESVTDGSQESHDDQIDAIAGAYSYLEGENDFAFTKVNVYR
jgi:predicted phage terminase large subunit-like protein